MCRGAEGAALAGREWAGLVDAATHLRTAQGARYTHPRCVHIDGTLTLGVNKKSALARRSTYSAYNRTPTQGPLQPPFKNAAIQAYETILSAPRLTNESPVPLLLQTITPSPHCPTTWAGAWPCCRCRRGTTSSRASRARSSPPRPSPHCTSTTTSTPFDLFEWNSGPSSMHDPPAFQVHLASFYASIRAPSALPTPSIHVTTCRLPVCACVPAA